MRSRPLSSARSARSALLARRARQMLLAPELSELKLWAAIRGHRLGVSFRRQVVIGERIADFLAPSARLVVEVDGGYHARRECAPMRVVTRSSSGSAIACSGWRPSSHTAAGAARSLLSLPTVPLDVAVSCRAAQRS